MAEQPDSVRLPELNSLSAHSCCVTGNLAMLKALNYQG